MATTLALTDTAEDALLGEFLAAAGYTGPTLYGALCSAVADGEAGSVTEIETPASNGYDREVFAFDAAASASTANSSLITYGTNTKGSDWGTATHLVLTSAQTGTINAANTYLHVELTTPRTVVDGGTATFAAGAFTVDAVGVGSGTFVTSELNAMLDGLLRATTYTGPGSANLHAGIGSNSTTECETPGTDGYTRQAVSAWTDDGQVSARSQRSNTNLITFGAATGDWANDADHMMLFDASTGGNLKAHAPMDSAVGTVSSGESVEVAAGSLKLVLG